MIRRASQVQRTTLLLTMLCLSTYALPCHTWDSYQDRQQEQQQQAYQAYQQRASSEARQQQQEAYRQQGYSWDRQERQDQQRLGLRQPWQEGTGDYSYLDRYRPGERAQREGYGR